MKKLVSALIMITFLFSSLTSYAAVPDFFTKDYNNYTTDGNMSLSFDSSDAVVDLLEKHNPDLTFMKIADLRSILSTLLKLDLAVTMEASVSDDYKKIQLAMTENFNHSLDISKNLNFRTTAKMSMWLNIDISSDEPVFEIIYLLPISNKYIHLDIFKICSEEERAQIISILNVFCNKTIVDTLNGASLKLLEKHATITTAGNICTVKLDNAGFIAFISDVTKTMSDISGLLSLANGGQTPPLELPSFEGVRLLGDKGITYKYTLSNGIPVKCEVLADISINLSEIVGEEWPDEKPLNLDFTIKSSMNMSKLGSTKVNFPVLTDDNSIKVDSSDIEMPSPSGYESYELMYPMSYARVFPEELTVINGEYYIPLRELMNSAYNSEIEIGYDNGTVTLESEWFKDFSKVILKKDSDIANVDGKEIPVSKVIIKDGTTYVSEKLLKDIFSWDIESINHNVMKDTYSIVVCTHNNPYIVMN